jgi:predicted DNA-binding transcriptional regulator AlpA
VIIFGHHEAIVDNPIGTDSAMTTTARQKPIARGMSERQASSYLGIAPGTFRKMIALGHFPQPMRLPGLKRVIHDRQALDRVMDARGSVSADGSTGTGA